MEKSQHLVHPHPDKRKLIEENERAIIEAKRKLEALRQHHGKGHEVDKEAERELVNLIDSLIAKRRSI